MRLYLIRHGQSEANLQQRLTGQMDVPLTAQGRKEAESIRPVLAKASFDHVYSSDLKRAMETQRIALPGHEAIITSLIREFSMGTLEGRLIAEVHAEMGQDFRTTRNYHPYGGENADDMYSRVGRFLDMVLENGGECAAAFLHNGAIHGVMQHVLGAEYNRSALHSSNCAVHVLEYSWGAWRLLAWNYMQPLE